MAKSLGEIQQLAHRSFSGSRKILEFGIRQIHSETDSYVDALGVRSECIAGNPSCCRGLIPAALPEILQAATTVAAWSDEDQKAFLERIRAKEAADQGFLNDEGDYVHSVCPFSSEGQCTIYENRPIECRSKKNTSEASVSQDGDELQTIDKLMWDVAVTARRNGFVGGVFEFGPAVAYVLQHPDTPIKPPAVELERFKIVTESVEKQQLTAKTGEYFKNPITAPALAAASRDDIHGLDNLLAGKEGLIADLFSLYMPAQYGSQQELDDRFGNLQSRLQRLHDADYADLFEVAELFNTFHWAYTGRNVTKPLATYSSALHNSLKRKFPQFLEPLPAQRRPGKFRLGICSPRIRSFNGSRWAFGLLTGLGDEIEVHVVNLAEQEDFTSLAFRRRAHAYWHLPMPALEAAPKIRDLDLDALILTDVGTCGRSIQLSCMRLARQQFNAWGHPVTSGSCVLDGYLSSEHMEPTNGDEHYTEKLIRLPKNGLNTPYRAAVPSDKSANNLGVPEDGFLLFAQVPYKVPPQDDGLLLELLDRSSKPVVFIGARFANEESLFRSRIGTKNCLYLKPLPRPDFLRLMQLADASIEMPSFGGGYTAIDALSVGTPVVTLPGEFMRGRLSRGYLIECGISGFVAKDREDFLDLATHSERQKENMRGFDPSSLFDNREAYAALSSLLLSGR